MQRTTRPVIMRLGVGILMFMIVSVCGSQGEEDALGDGGEVESLKTGQLEVLAHELSQDGMTVALNSMLQVDCVGSVVCECTLCSHHLIDPSVAAKGYATNRPSGHCSGAADLTPTQQSTGDDRLFDCE